MDGSDAPHPAPRPRGPQVKELSPGIRSLLIGFDRDEVDAYSLCAMLEKLDGSLVVV